MADVDLTARFENISENAKNVAERLKAARQGTREQLETDAANARTAADELKDKAVGEQAKPSWQAHVTADALKSVVS
ncbi:MAG TPA: hypothetical protein VHU62_10015 [Mycobacterium sp.]|nr:hypothetical protein [Mycobacterium sp.]